MEVVSDASSVSNSPYRVTADQIEQCRRMLRRRLGRKREFFINIHATYAVRSSESAWLAESLGACR